MRYRLLGPSGLRVSEVALGAMTFGAEGWGSERDEATRIFEAYTEGGGNFIDTADFYGLGESERWVSELVGRERDRFVIASKYGLVRRPDDPNAFGSHRKSLVTALEASLQRLGTDYIDLYWIHAWDPYTSMTEVMRALDDVVRAGKVLYLGISDTPAWVVARANTLAEDRGWTPFVAYQGRYSLLDRGVERDVLPMASALGLSFVAWGMLGSGLLSGKYTPAGAETGTATGAGGRLEVTGRVGKESPRDMEIVRTVGAVADELGVTPSQVAVRWVFDKPGVIPLLGARTLAQLEDNLAALDVELTDDHRTRLEKATTIDLGFPHSFIEPGRGFLYGPTWSNVEPPPVRRV
jgi:aryl-alcohol dehydrogenase-like predicted oxidoreductase